MFDFPASPITGQVVTGPGGVQWQFDGTKWVVASGSGAGAGVTISDTAPPSPAPGAMWLDSVSGQLYIFYADPNSSQWIPASNQGGAPAILPPGVTNGSNAAAGQIGEVISASQATNTIANATWTSNTPVTLTPGDWDVVATAALNVSATPNDLTVWFLGFSTTLNGAPTQPIGASGQSITMAGVTIAAPRTRFNVTTSTTVYPTVYAARTGGGTCTVVTNITARRVR